MKLNLPPYQHRVKELEGKRHIYDRVRKRFVLLTPEEWVRQNFIHFLIEERGFPASLISVEMPIKINGLNRRSDIVLYNSQVKPIMVVECKAPSVKINQQTFDQITRYNATIKVQHLVVTNGMSHYCCQRISDENQYAFIKDIPSYIDLCSNAHLK